MVLRGALVRTVVFLVVIATIAALSAAKAHAIDVYSVSGQNLLKNGTPTVWAGVNALHQYGGSSSAMAGWNIGIVREAIGAVSETPVGSGFVWGSAGNPLHGLQDVVNDNRANGKITILCPFSWTDNGPQFAGTNPRTGYSTAQWNAFLNKMRDWGAQFAGQSDVWIETWNEPNPTDNDPNWYADQKAIIDAIRSSGNTNIIVVPGCNWGSSESVILNQGQALLNSQSNKNIVFDLHCYNWTWDWQSQNEARIQSVWNKNLALILGEIGPGVGGGYVVNPSMVLNAALAKRITTLGWYWNDRTGDPNALFANGQPNNTNNYSWHTTFRSFLNAFAVNAKLVDGVYYLSPLCAPSSGLEVNAWNNWDGATVDLWFNDGAQNLAWYVQRQSGNIYKLVSFGGAGPRVLDVDGAGTADGTKVQLWTDNSSSAQRWTVTYTSAGNYKLIPQCAPGKALDVNGAGSANGTVVQIWTDNGTNAQRWSFKTHN